MALASALRLNRVQEFYLDTEAEVDAKISSLTLALPHNIFLDLDILA